MGNAPVTMIPKIPLDRMVVEQVDTPTRAIVGVAMAMRIAGEHFVIVSDSVIALHVVFNASRGWDHIDRGEPFNEAICLPVAVLPREAVS
jgi:hypothetical protein